MRKKASVTSHTAQNVYQVKYENVACLLSTERRAFYLLRLHEATKQEEVKKSLGIEERSRDFFKDSRPNVRVNPREMISLRMQLL
jgi:hypothetical protein